MPVESDADTPTTRATTALSEVRSKEIVAQFGVPIAPYRACDSVSEAVTAAQELGFPVVAKLCGDEIAHKTERGLVKLGLRSTQDVERAAQELLDARLAGEETAQVLISPMVRGIREFICGVFRDANFGPMIMLGVGGVMAEAIDDVVLGVAPLDTADANALIDRLRTQPLLDELRGEPAVDRDALASALVGLSDLAIARPDIVEVDLNPMIIADGLPIAVDALVVTNGAPSEADVRAGHNRFSNEQFNALFNPKGVVVAGASSHPGKFGFVTLHNLRAGGFQGVIAATKLDGEDVLGFPTLTSLDALDQDSCDLLVVCTPPAAIDAMLPVAAAKGIKAVFMTTAGFGEAGEEGRKAQARLIERCNELGLLLAGPNGQGVVSPPSKLCAQIVGPNPPKGRVAVASQSGNLVSSFLNHAVRSGVGISRAISAGNAAVTGVIDYLEWFATDEETAASIVYIEGLPDGRNAFDRLSAIAPTKPVIVVKGGATDAGAKAAASHTGSLASDDRIIDAVLRQAGAIRVDGVETAFDAAAAFATQPLPAGGRVAVVTTVGGWGVLASDAISRTRHLRLAELDEAAFAAIDALLPPRWSRNNPIDMAGGETRDSVPQILEILASNQQIDALIFLGLGIQSNQAALMRSGPFYPDHGLERIVDYHERQDRRYVDASAELSARFAKPILIATELAATHPDNPGVARLRELGLYGFSSAERAVAALDSMVEFAQVHHSTSKKAT